MLNTTETLLNFKKPACEKFKCLINSILLIIICTLSLAVHSIGSYYYYTRDWIKIEHVLSY